MCEEGCRNIAHLTPLQACSRCREARIFRDHDRGRYARANAAKHVKQMVFVGDDVSTHAHGAEELYFFGTAATDGGCTTIDGVPNNGTSLTVHVCQVVDILHACRRTELEDCMSVAVLEHTGITLQR